MDEQIPDIIKARELQIYDNKDKVRISLSAIGGVAPTITFYKEDQTPAIEITSIEKDSDSRRITLFGKSEKWRFHITSNNNGAGINIFDKNGKVVGVWGFFENDTENSSENEK